MLFPWISQTFELKNNDLKKKKGKTGQCIVPLPLVLFSLWAERWVGREGAMPRELSVLQFYNRRKSEGGKDHFLPYSSVGIKLPSLAPPPCQMEEFSCPSIIKPGLSLCA